MSLAGLCRRITQFGFNLLEKEFALDARIHVVRQLTRTRYSLTWKRDDPDGPLILGDPARILDYISILKRKDYSFLLRDGAVVQLSYTFDRESVDSHRLVYYPCPFSIDISLMDQFDASLTDLINGIYLDDVESVVLKSPIRFDYAPEVAADFHPASHVTFNSNTCRIPVRAPMRFDQFMRFIIEKFYPDTLEDESVARQLLHGRHEECLSAHDRSRMHLNWRVV